MNTPDIVTTPQTAPAGQVKPAGAPTNKNAFRYARWTPETRLMLYDAAADWAYTMLYTDENGLQHLFSTRKKGENGGVAQVHLGEYTVQVTTAMTFRANFPPPRYWYEEVSHLCGLQDCLTHVRWELPWINISRDGCHKYGHWATCPHDEQCLAQPDMARARKAIEAGIKERCEKTAAQKAKAKRNAANYAKNKETIQEKSRQRMREVRNTPVEKQRKRQKS